MGNVETNTNIAPRPVTRPIGTHFGAIVNRIHEMDRLSAADRAVVKFLAPKRMVPSSRQRTILNAAKVSTHDVKGVPLKVYLWENVPGCPFVLLGHGFMMNAASMLGFVKPLLQAGFSVVAWDQPGHGESDGDSTFVQYWADAFPTIGQQFTPLAGIIGFSLGGTTALMALAENPSFECPSIVCINSPRQVDTVMTGFLMKHGCSPDLVPLMHYASDLRGWRFPEIDKCFMATADGLPKTKCLFIQDHHDNVASEAEARYWASKTINSTLEMSSGLKHHGILAGDQWIRKIVAYLETQTTLPRKYKSRL